MSALRKVAVVETRESWTPIVIEGSRNKAAEAPVAAPAAGAGALIKNMALFLSAPFVGLVYAVLLPFVGMGMLLSVAGKALMKQAAFREVLAYAKFLVKMAVAPFVGLAYIVALPFIGIAMLLWNGGKALIGVRTPE